MSTFTIRIELKGRNFDREEYVQLHGLMAGEGFKCNIDSQPILQTLNPRQIQPPPKPLSSLPHATYFGESDLPIRALRDHLVNRITTDIQPDIVLFVAETVHYEIYPE